MGGVIDVDEFCQGCLNVQGEARSFDLHFLMVEHRRALHKWGEFMGFVEDHVEDVEARLMRIEELMRMGEISVERPLLCSSAGLPPRGICNWSKSSISAA